MFGILAGTDLKYSGMCKAGFSGVSAPHAVLPEVYRKIGFWEMALILGVRGCQAPHPKPIHTA